MKSFHKVVSEEILTLIIHKAMVKIILAQFKVHLITDIKDKIFN
jgi:hypothetical protein